VASSNAFVWDINSTWYKTLVTPAFSPPSWLFGPVWTILYLLIATSAYRFVFMKDTNLKSILLGLWALQICLNTIWVSIYFGANDLLSALVVILILWVCIVFIIMLSWSVDRVSSFLLLPYFLWVSFASILNASYWYLN
jgi:tryptophan-rich sensory protein